MSSIVQFRQQHRLALKACLILLVVYMIWPVFHSVHPEGFTAQIQVAAAAANAGMLDKANVLYPMHAEYFYLTRIGVVLLLQALMALSGSLDDSVFRVLVMGSWVLLIVASMIFARQRANVGFWWSGAALLLTPGIVELAFSFSDNVVSAAFGILGLALLSAGLPLDSPPDQHTAPPTKKVFAAGCALGFAVVCRPDALLLLPLFLGLCLIDAGRWRGLVAALALLATGIGSSFFIAYFLSGASLLQAVQSARFFDRIHSGVQASFGDKLFVLVVFAGVPQLVLVPIGAFLQWQANGQNRHKQRLLLIALPLAMLAYFISHSNEARQFYPLLMPFIALHGGQALRWLGTVENKNRWLRLARTLIIATVLVIWLAPPLLIRLRDGPRGLLGRLWSPLIWREWQQAVARNRDDIEQLIDKADRVPKLTLLTMHWNTDHYLRLSLWQRGYRPFDASKAIPACAGGFEAWQKPGEPEHLVLHIRTENPHFSQRPEAYAEAIQLQKALECKLLFQAVPVIASGQGQYMEASRAQRLLTEMKPALARKEVSFGMESRWSDRVAGRISWLRPSNASPRALELNRSAPLSEIDLTALRQEVDASVHDFNNSSTTPFASYGVMMARFGPKVAWPRVLDGKTTWEPPQPAVNISSR
jgi:hypothetical protein